VRTPESALRELLAYVRQTIPRRLEARRRDRRRVEVEIYDQVRRDLCRILDQVPPGLLERETLDPEQRRREINTVFCAATSRGYLPPIVVQELWALRARLQSELRGSAQMVAAPVPPSS